MEAQIIIYSLALLLVFYMLALALGRHRLIKDYKGAMLAFCFLAMFGPVGEILVGSFYSSITGGAYLWEYKILPVHGGYTSLIAPLIWGVAGVYAHLFWGYLNAIKNRFLRYTVIALDILAIEVVLNAVFYLLFNEYVFYYHPPDLLHFSSLQALPFYLLAGLVTVRAVKYSSVHPRFYSTLFIAIALVITYLA